MGFDRQSTGPDFERVPAVGAGAHHRQEIAPVNQVRRKGNLHLTAPRSLAHGSVELGIVPADFFHERG